MIEDKAVDLTKESRQQFATLLKSVNYKHDVWRRFGFQRNDMSTDFRASGLLGAV